jgi:hypothetical protein
MKKLHRHTVSSAYGAVKPIGREEDLRAVSREAREDRAEYIIHPESRNGGEES